MAAAEPAQAGSVAFAHPYRDVGGFQGLRHDAGQVIPDRVKVRWPRIDASAGCGTGFGRLSGGRIIFACWRLGFRQSSFSHITRVPQRAVPYVWARPLLFWHAIVPVRFPVQVSHQTQEPPFESLPAEPGIQQSASRRRCSMSGRTGDYGG